MRGQTFVGRTVADTSCRAIQGRGQVRHQWPRQRFTPLELIDVGQRHDGVGRPGHAELLLRVSAYMDPWGATAPMDWWSVVNRTRAIENTACVLAVNQGAEAEHYPPFSWPGGSMIVDYDVRILAQADPGPGDRVVVAPIDLERLRAEPILI